MLKHFSDERQSDRENPPRPLGFHPNAQRARVWDPGLRVKIGPYFVAGLDGGACHSLRPSPRLARFSRATLFALIV